MTEYVIDASSVLAFVFNEPGGEIVQDAARQGVVLHISAVNLAEVYAKLTDKGFTEQAIDLFLGTLDLHVVPLDHVLGQRSGLMRLHVDRSLSLGDRCCLAVGEAMTLPILTADRAWVDHASGLGLDLIITR